MSSQSNIRRVQLAFMVVRSDGCDLVMSVISDGYQTRTNIFQREHQIVSSDFLGEEYVSMRKKTFREAAKKMALARAGLFFLSFTTPSDRYA